MGKEYSLKFAKVFDMPCGHQVLVKKEISEDAYALVFEVQFGSIATDLKIGGISSLESLNTAFENADQEQAAWIFNDLKESFKGLF